MKRFWVLAAVAGIALAVPSLPAANAAKPVRTGSVAGGPIDTGPSSSCQLSADCLVWLASGCSPYLAGLDPAVQSSIVDVSDLAGRRTVRRFVVLPGSSSGAPGVVIGGFRVQFWTAGCAEVEPDLPAVDENTTYYPEYIRTASRFRIPARAAWMTAVADDNLVIRWEMY